MVETTANPIFSATAQNGIVTLASGQRIITSAAIDCVIAGSTGATRVTMATRYLAVTPPTVEILDGIEIQSDRA